MKRTIQLFLFFSLIIMSILFYKKYFINLDTIQNKNLSSQKEKQNEPQVENRNNVIQNLKYDVRLNDNSKYTITADESEIMYIEDVELVSMNIVVAKFINFDNSELTITSDKAVFNNSNYNTNFESNVKIIYLNHTIRSNKLDLSLDKNIVKIYDNVVYQGLQGEVETDNIVINLITKNTDIFMDNPKNKVTVNTN